MCRKAVESLASETGLAQTPQRLQTMSELSSLVIKSCPGIPQEDKDMAMGVLKSITSKLDQLDMSDPSTIQSVGGSLVESVGSLLDEPERDEEVDDGKLASDLEKDQSLSPKERLQKSEDKEQEYQAKRRRLVQEGRQVLDGLFNAIIGGMRLGAPPVTIERGGITLHAQRIWSDRFGDQVVQTEDGSFQTPSEAALFQDYTPHSVAIKLMQFQQNPFTWGRGEYQPRSSVMELSLQQNNIPGAFNNLTEDFSITIPANSGNKPATATITFPAPGNGSSRHHLLNLTNAAEGFLVTITPLNTSVVYRVSGRYGSRPDDQNYNMSTETYILPEECALMKTLSGEEDTDKTEAKMFISGKDGPEDYYIKVQILGPVTECGREKKAAMKEPRTNDSYAYQIEWARLSCVFWNETQEAWRPDGCVISNQSTITSTICHCNHLTSFGGDFFTPPNTLIFENFEELNFSDLVDNSAVLSTIIVALCLYSLSSVAIKIAERTGKKIVNHAVKLDNLQHNFRYRLLIWTGAAKHAGTESTVAFKLVGDAANSGVRLVDITEKVFTQTSQVTLTFSTAEQLGKVELLQLMHDNSGEGSRASWHVDRAAVQDLTSGKLFYFFCDEWLAADRGDGQVVKTFPVASEEDLRTFGFLFPASLHRNLTEEHLFLSVATMPKGSTFTRSERLGCCLSFFAVSMVSSAMWLKDEIETQVVQGFSLGPFSFTLNGVYTGFMTSITCLPVVMVIVLLFQYSRPSNRGNRRVRDLETGNPPEAPTQQGPAKGLPHGCKYVAWVLVVLSSVGSAVFTMLYSMQWGKDKSKRWLSAFLITFLVDTFLLQPGKRQVVEKIFEENRGHVWMEANAESGFNCNAFRKRRKMERLSTTSLINIKQARMKQHRDRRAGEILRGIMVSGFCLLLVLSITNEHHNTTPGFYQTQSTTNTFVQSMDEVDDAHSLWSWLNETDLENFYPETSYNGDKLRWQEKGFTADMQSILVAPPSMIQARVKSGLCTVPAAMQQEFDECSSAYNEHTKETGTFQKGWKRVRNMSATESEAPGWTHLPSGYPSLPIYGVTMQYWGDGFGLNLGKSADEMRSILAELKANRWIDKRTRAIFLEALLYNGNLDLFTSLTMVFEFSETAGVFTHHRVQAFRLHQRPGTIGYIYVLLEIIYVIVLLYTLWKETKTARAAGWAYLKEPWNIVEIFNFFLAFTVIALYSFKRIYSSKALAAINNGKDEVHHFRSAVNISLVYGWFLAFLTYVSMLKFLRLLRFNPFLAKLMSMFRGMYVEFSSFTLYLFIYLSAFGVYAHLMFGLTVTEYSTISKSFSTLFQMSLGNIYYYELREAAPILGPIYFFAFICIIFLVLMNIAMAIIDSALSKVRNHIMSEEDQDFIQGLWERFSAFFGFWKVPLTDNNCLDTLHDSMVEVEIKVEKLWLQRQWFGSLLLTDASRSSGTCQANRGSLSPESSSKRQEQRKAKGTIDRRADMMESDVVTEPEVQQNVAADSEVRQIVAAVWVVTGEGVCLPDNAAEWYDPYLVASQCVIKPCCCLEFGRNLWKVERPVLSQQTSPHIAPGVKSLCAAFETADVQKRGSIDVQIVPKLVQDVLGSSLAPSEKDAIRLRAESKAKKGVLYFADFVEVMSETLQTTTQWGKLTTTLSGYVGIDTLQEQMRKKALKRGFEFHIMVVGGSGLGKSTLVNTLFKAQISRRSCTNESEGTIPKTVQIKSVSHVIEEKGVRLKLTVTDTPGFGDQINNENCWLPILEFINDQYEKYLSEEVNVSRKKHIPDTRVHVCLYFISPTGHSCRPLDLEFMKRLDKVVNIVPIIAKADTLTLEERYAFKKRVREDLEFHGIQFYPMKSLDEDEEETAINQALREKMPFAIVGSDREYQVNGKSVLGRKTKWGLIEVENKNHCEFALLRDMLIRTHMQDLKDVTDSIHYENFRRERLEMHSEFAGPTPPYHEMGESNL
ncbi:PREDICTED: polycystic kidney disease protein 1-like 2 [Branchiostoma belcheri]|nr:PREDICTED: polycystic kidney disease protein 1-like 2 [Branchiostoma belcheri]